jgi:hypothetical protein
MRHKKSLMNGKSELKNQNISAPKNAEQDIPKNHKFSKTSRLVAKLRAKISKKNAFAP